MALLNRAMKFFDRLLTIVITATLTSAFWIVFGTAIMQAAEDNTETHAPIEEAPEPATVPVPAAPSLEIEPVETAPEPAPIAPENPAEAMSADPSPAAPSGAEPEAEPEIETEEEAGA